MYFFQHQTISKAVKIATTAIMYVFLLAMIACRTKPALDSGEIVLKEQDAFGEVIELRDEKIETNFVIDPRIRGMLLKNDRLVLQYEKNPPLVILALPALNFITNKGTRGNGPDEFIFPALVPATSQDVICYVFEQTNRKIYTLDNRQELSYYAFDLPKSNDHIMTSQVMNMGENDFIYVESVEKGISIMRATQKGNDSIECRQVCSLLLKPDLESPVPYKVYMAANAKKNRIVCAYMYYKIIKFIDLESGAIKTINFKQSEFDENTLRVADGLDLNVTHYWGICGGDMYVYLYYVGRTPEETAKMERPFAYVEQYDWDGNPIRKYKLNRTGRFVVNEQTKCLYLADFGEDDPFYVYHLPVQ
jgi:hypothetical protein